MTWQLQEAKNKLSEVVDKSLQQGPQIISRRGKNTAVVMSYEEYQKLVKPPQSFKEFVLAYKDIEMPEIDRNKSTTGRATPVDFNDLDL